MKSKRSVWVKYWLKNRLETSGFNNIFVQYNILNLLKKHTFTFTFCNYLNYIYLLNFCRRH